MHLMRSKPLFAAALFLAIILQVLTPFLHAHTGASSQFGIHLHVASTGFESAQATEAGKLFLTNTNEESPEVGVPVSRQSCFSLICLGICNVYLSPNLLFFYFR
ncbi:MAG: hypothetical protein B7X83_07540 [Polynucleobacter sp. 17-46-58]|nr:MAG: hypothetical protein B7X83_07540 [Polynucleobacter sp. 17-46-58]